MVECFQLLLFPYSLGTQGGRTLYLDAMNSAVISFGFRVADLGRRSLAYKALAATRLSSTLKIDLRIRS